MFEVGSEEALTRWPPSAAQTARTVFPHAAFTATDRTLWAKSYQKSLTDVLSLQEEVARAISGEIRIKLTPEEQARLARVRPVNPGGTDLARQHSSPQGPVPRYALRVAPRNAARSPPRKRRAGSAERNAVYLIARVCFFGSSSITYPRQSRSRKLV
jgi:hypothetical protein